MIPIPRDAVPFDGCSVCGRTGVYNCCNMRRHALEFLVADGGRFDLKFAAGVPQTPAVREWAAQVKAVLLAEMQRELAALAEQP